MVSKAVFSRRISADIAGGIAIGLYACNISNTIIHVNEGFVKGFVVLTDKLTEGVVKKKDRQMSVLSCYGILHHIFVYNLIIDKLNSFFVICKINNILFFDSFFKALRFYLTIRDNNIIITKI